jgi:hypothetical protein
MTAAAPAPTDNNDSSNEGDEEEDRRMRMRSFLYVICYDLSCISDNLHRLLGFNEEYAKSGSLDSRRGQVREHAGAALRDVDERGKCIRRLRRNHRFD